MLCEVDIKFDNPLEVPLWEAVKGKVGVRLPGDVEHDIMSTAGEAALKDSVMERLNLNKLYWDFKVAEGCEAVVFVNPRIGVTLVANCRGIESVAVNPLKLLTSSDDPWGYFGDDEFIKGEPLVTLRRLLGPLAKGDVDAALGPVLKLVMALPVPVDIGGVIQAFQDAWHPLVSGVPSCVGGERICFGGGALGIEFVRAGAITRLQVSIDDPDTRSPYGGKKHRRLIPSPEECLSAVHWAVDPLRQMPKRKRSSREPKESRIAQCLAVVDGTGWKEPGTGKSVIDVYIADHKARSAAAFRRQVEHYQARTRCRERVAILDLIPQDVAEIPGYLTKHVAKSVEAERRRLSPVLPFDVWYQDTSFLDRDQ